MPNPPEYFLKLFIGDLAAQLALAQAEIERLREEIDQLKTKPPTSRLEAV